MHLRRGFDKPKFHLETYVPVKGKTVFRKKEFTALLHILGRELDFHEAEHEVILSFLCQMIKRRWYPYRKNNIIICNYGH